MSVPTALESTLYFHTMALICGKVEIRKTDIIRNEVSSMLEGMAGQPVQRASDAIT